MIARASHAFRHYERFRPGLDARVVVEGDPGWTYRPPYGGFGLGERTWPVEEIKDGRVSAVIDEVHGGTRDEPSRGVVLAVTVRD
jgi:hypothetical protein